jgi:hypothetical protein
MAVFSWRTIYAIGEGHAFGIEAVNSESNAITPPSKHSPLSEGCRPTGRPAGACQKDIVHCGCYKQAVPKGTSQAVGRGLYAVYSNHSCGRPDQPPTNRPPRWGLPERCCALWLLQTGRPQGGLLRPTLDRLGEAAEGNPTRQRRDETARQSLEAPTGRQSHVLSTLPSTCLDKLGVQLRQR